MGNNLTHKPLDNVGVNGINTQHSPMALDSTWMAKADNIVFRESGRITFRKGIKQLVLPTTGEVGSIIEHKAGTVNKVFASVGNKVYEISFGTPGAAFTNPSPVFGTKSNWQFVNFNKQLFGFQDNHDVINYDDTDTSGAKWDELKDRTGYVAPSGISVFDPSCGLGYYGRLWAGGITEEKDVVHYSDTLIPTVWYNDTPVTTVAVSTAYIVNEVKDETTTTVINVGYKINSLKDLTAIVLDSTYDIISDIRDIESSTVVNALYYEILLDESAAGDWSGVGGPATAVVGDVFECSTGTDISSLGKVKLSWLNLGAENDSTVGSQFTATATDGISEYGAVRLSDWSAFGGPASPKINDTFVATTAVSISLYGDVIPDWTAIGGPAIANVNDAFVSKDTLSLLDITAYGKVVPNSGLAGYIDLKTVWGTDEIVAIGAHYGKLIIFGKHNIAIYSNPQDPGSLSLDEVIKGIGCVSKDSIQEIGDDLIFLSETGLRSLARTTEKDNIPLQDLSANITETLVRSIGQNRNVKSVYIESEGIYLLSFVDIDKTYVFDFKHMTPNSNPRITTWSFTSKLEPRCFAYTESKGFLLGVDRSLGSIAEYSGYYDKEYTGAGPSYNELSYTASFKTTWIDLGEGVSSSILKKLKAVIGGGPGTPITLSWYTDFGSNKTSLPPFTISPVVTLAPSLYRAKHYTGTGTLPLYGAAYFTKSSGLKEYSLPLKGTAKYLQLEMSADTVGHTAVLQDLTLLIKQGKIV